MIILIKYIVNISAILTIFFLNGCGGGSINSGATEVLKTDDSVKISYSWNKLTESSLFVEG